MVVQLKLRTALVWEYLRRTLGKDGLYTPIYEGPYVVLVKPTADSYSNLSSPDSYPNRSSPDSYPNYSSPDSYITCEFLSRESTAGHATQFVFLSAVHSQQFVLLNKDLTSNPRGTTSCVTHRRAQTCTKTQTQRHTHLFTRRENNSCWFIMVAFVRRASSN